VNLLCHSRGFYAANTCLGKKSAECQRSLQEKRGGLTYDTDQELLTAMDRLLNDSCYRDRLARLSQALEQNWSADAHLRSYFPLIDKIATARWRFVEENRTNFCCLAPQCIPADHSLHYEQDGVLADREKN